MPGKISSARCRGYNVPPHFHPADEAATVISGSFNLGMGINSTPFGHECSKKLVEPPGVDAKPLPEVENNKTFCSD